MAFESAIFISLIMVSGILLFLFLFIMTESKNPFKFLYLILAFLLLLAALYLGIMFGNDASLSNSIIRSMETLFKVVGIVMGIVFIYYIIDVIVLVITSLPKQKKQKGELF